MEIKETDEIFFPMEGNFKLRDGIELGYEFTLEFDKLTLTLISTQMFDFIVDMKGREFSSEVCRAEIAKLSEMNSDEFMLFINLMNPVLDEG